MSQIKSILASRGTMASSKPDVVMIETALLVFAPALGVILVAGTLLFRFAEGALRANWVATLLLITAALFSAEAVAITLEMNRLVGPDGFAALALGLALVSVALVAFFVRRQIGGPFMRPSLWVGTAIAAFSLIAKTSTGGWELFGEMLMGIAVGTPVVHVLVRLVASERRKELPVLLAGVASDALLLLGTMLRIDATDTPSWVAYRKLFFDEYGVSSWLTWTSTDLNYGLCVPVVVSWALLLWLSARKRGAAPPNGAREAGVHLGEEQLPGPG